MIIIFDIAVVRMGAAHVLLAAQGVLQGRGSCWSRRCCRSWRTLPSTAAGSRRGSLRSSPRWQRTTCCYATDDDLRRVARIGRLDEVLDRLPDGWDTAVGEGGSSLSGGEKQRVSIARALLKDAPVVLLDEATAALDPVNEAALTEAVSELARDRTVIVVAHRLSTVAAADQILVLDRGRITERGDHDTLLAAGGTYTRFWTERLRARGWQLTPRHAGEGRQ